MLEYTHVIHEIDPIYDAGSEMLILGSFPSVRSRESNFFYGNPQNRFWKVLQALTMDILPETTEEKKEFLHRNHIAVWDVVAQCDISGSSDSSIKNVVPVDISLVLNAARIQAIYANGNTAYKLYQKYLLPVTERKCTPLPSTSPANAAYSLDKLIETWTKKCQI